MKISDVVQKSDTGAGRAFDYAILFLVVFSIVLLFVERRTRFVVCKYGNAWQLAKEHNGFVHNRICPALCHGGAENGLRFQFLRRR